MPRRPTHWLYLTEVVLFVSGVASCGGNVASTGGDDGGSAEGASSGASSSPGGSSGSSSGASGGSSSGNASTGSSSGAPSAGGSPGSALPTTLPCSQFGGGPGGAGPGAGSGTGGGGGSSGGGQCSAMFSETCGGISFDVSCACPQGTCACFGPTTTVVAFSGCPVCPGPNSESSVFALCGFPR